MSIIMQIYGHKIHDEMLIYKLQKIQLAIHYKILIELSIVFLNIKFGDEFVDEIGSIYTSSTLFSILNEYNTFYIDLQFFVYHIFVIFTVIFNVVLQSNILTKE